MGTKNNPGNFDCYEKADPDEPMFVLLARDPLAPYLVKIWAQLRQDDHANAVRLLSDAMRIRQKEISDEKWREAVVCAQNMQAWAEKN